MPKRSKPGSTAIEFGESYMPRGSDASRARIEDVGAKHDIVGQAAAAGRKDEPLTTEKQLSATEQTLIDESVGFIGAASRTAASEVTERVDAMRGHMPPLLDTTLEQAAIKHKAVEAESRYGKDVEDAYAGRQKASRDLSGFEADNKLAPGSAVYKDDTAMFWSQLAALGIGEAVLNAFLFAELQDRGLVGGLMLALATGLANVLLGLGTGFLGWRLMNHVKPGPKILGLVLTSLFMNGALALHLALGDLREAIAHDANASIDFLVILKPWRWFDYHSIPPFVLFAVGIATFVVAALKGRGGTWGIVAPYWGHEAFDRRFRAADRAFQDAVENFEDAIQNAFDGERSNLRAQFTEGTAAVGEIRRLANEAHGIASTLGDAIQEEIGRNHIWLRLYRDTNRQVRTSKPPAYFATYPSFAEWRRKRLDLSDITRTMAAAERRVAENTAKLAALEEAILRDQVAAIEHTLAKVGERKKRAEVTLDRDEAVKRPKRA